MLECRSKMLILSSKRNKIDKEKLKPEKIGLKNLWTEWQTVSWKNLTKFNKKKMRWSWDMNVKEKWNWEEQKRRKQRKSWETNMKWEKHWLVNHKWKNYTRKKLKKIWTNKVKCGKKREKYGRLRMRDFRIR